MRSTGKPVEGHVEADSEEWAFHALANNGIITESLRPDPVPGQARTAPKTQTVPAESRVAGPLLPPMMPPVAPVAPVASGPQRPAVPPGSFHLGAAANTQTFAQQSPPPAPPVPAANGAGVPAGPRSQFDSALDGALDGASSQIDFDALTERYRGKKVWVIDRDKIRRNVARVVDQALAQSIGGDESSAATRERVADAINELFKDSRNLTSQYNQTNVSLEKQIGRLASVIKQFEGALVTMQSAIRGIGSGGGGGGGGPRRSRGVAIGQSQEQNAVLLEIFKTNLDLLRTMEDEMRASSGAVLDDAIEGGETAAESEPAGAQTATAVAEAEPTGEGGGDESPAESANGE